MSKEIKSYLAQLNLFDCQQKLDGIEAIDFFFAKQMLTYYLTRSTNQNESDIECDLNQLTQLFHLFLALQWHQRQGHTCLPLSAIANHTLWQNTELGLMGFKFVEHEVLIQLLSLVGLNHQQEDINTPLVFELDALYIRRYWQFEQEVATDLIKRQQFTAINQVQLNAVKQVFSLLFPTNHSAKTGSNIPETDWQQVAVANALGRKLNIICGGPGTGKTYTVTRLLAALQTSQLASEHTKLIIKMAAPTGKAAQRLKESIVDAKKKLAESGVASEILSALPEEATTLHRLLGFRPNSLHLSHDNEHKIRCDVLLVDEVSMIDLAMMARLLRALSTDTIVIMLGDADQLPSVETGNILADLVGEQHCGYSNLAAKQIMDICNQNVSLAIENGSGHSHITFLTKTHRFGGDIGNIAKEVIQSQVKSCWQRLLKAKQVDVDNLTKLDELAYFSFEQLEAWLVAACRIYYLPITRSKTVKDAFKALTEFRILVPMRVGLTGVERLNTQIEQILVKLQPSIRVNQHYIGRPIMVIENSYTTGLFNGDVGLIWPDEHGKLLAWFETESGFHKISLARLPKVETVYAMTIHKTQGSEFARVAMILPEQMNDIISPELIYTGLTRAKKQLTILANPNVWQAGVANKSQRFSNLSKRLYNEA